MKYTDLVKLKFLPASVDCGLLLLRVWFGSAILLNHGWGKLQNFSRTVAFIKGSTHLPTLLAWLAITAETVFSALLIIGFLTRFSAAMLAATMAVAFFMVHHHALGVAPGSPGPGEPAFLYLGVFVGLFLAGAGRFSVDGKS